jgi:DNA-binding NarL/FixJ family response regulator
LALSVKTVSTHKRRIMSKLGVANNAALIQWALKERLVEVADIAAPGSH